MTLAQGHRPTVTLRQAIAQYLEKITPTKRGAAQEKFRAASILRHPIADRILDEITQFDVVQYRDYRLSTPNPQNGKIASGSTIRLEFTLMSQVFIYSAEEWGWCAPGHNPVKGVRKPKLPPGRTRRLTAEEERLILTACQGRQKKEMWAMFILAIETAMRQGEMLGLRWEDVDLKNRIVHLAITKNDSPRDVPLTMRAREVFIALGPKTEGSVFTYTQQGFKASWRTMVKQLGITDLRFHDLRHHAVSLLFERGGLDMMEIALISGHKTLAMLKRYTHLRAADLVRKLDKHKSRSKAAIISNLIPYPAIIEVKGERIRLTFPDLDNLGNGIWLDPQIGIEVARDLLLRELIQRMYRKEPIPKPGRYPSTQEKRVAMVDPVR